MQTVFEKIIEKLKERRMLHADLSQSDKLTEQERGVQSRFCGCFCKAIEIVKQEAVQYNNDQINQLAMMYAKNLVQFGVDITKIWDTAIQQTAALNQAYIRGRQDERDRLEQYNNGWIPCSERLPELLEDITKDEDTFLKSCYLVTDGVFVCQAIFDEHGEFIDTLDFEPLIVTAWQPLPEPYQQKG